MANLQDGLIVTTAGVINASMATDGGTLASVLLNATIKLLRSGVTVAENRPVVFSIKGFVPGDFGTQGDRAYAEMRDFWATSDYRPGDRLVVAYVDGTTPSEPYWEIQRAILLPPPGATGTSPGWMVSLLSMGQ